MAYWIDHNNAYVPDGQTCFISDSVDDIANLPTFSAEGVPQGDSVTHRKVNPGASCLVISTSEVYMLNSEDIWVSI